MNLSLAGTEYVNPPADLAGQHSNYISDLNSTDVVESWKPGGLIGQIPILGDLFSQLYQLWTKVSFLITGFPQLLTWVGGAFITDAGVRAGAYTTITNALQVIFGLMMVIFIIEFISGRRMPD